MELILRSADPVSGQDEYVVIDKQTYYIGRRSDNDYQVLHPEVSGTHAEFRFSDDVWWVEDTHSTNGTFVNGVRISRPKALKARDIVHFGTKGFRVVSSIRRRASASVTKLAPESTQKARAAFDFFHIIHGGLAYPKFQPLVDLRTRKVVGWEALGRAATEEPRPPDILFRLAEKTDLATTLSRTFRAAAMDCLLCRHCWQVDGRPYILLNLHPHEILTPRFAGYLEEISWGKIMDHHRVVLEIPESLVCNGRELRVWVQEIRRQGMLVAYDDFGKGQSRIADLVNAPPDFLKLDRELVEGLGENGVKDDLVQAIVEACGRLQVRIVAEGIEKETEFTACTRMGIHYGQGHFLTPPLPAWELFGADTAELPSSCPFVSLDLLPRTIGGLERGGTGRFGPPPTPSVPAEGQELATQKLRWPVTSPK